MPSEIVDVMQEPERPAMMGVPPGEELILKERKEKKKKKLKKSDKKQIEGTSERQETAAGDEEHRKREKKSKKKAKKSSKKAQYGGQATEEGIAKMSKTELPDVTDKSEPSPLYVGPNDVPSVSQIDEAEKIPEGASTFIEMSQLQMDMDRKLTPQEKQQSERFGDNNSVHSEDSSIFSSHPISRKNSVSYERSSMLEDTDSCVGGMIGRSDESVGTATFGKASDDMTWSGFTLSSQKDESVAMNVPFEVAAKPLSKKKKKAKANPPAQKAQQLVQSLEPAPQQTENDMPLSWDVFGKADMFNGKADKSKEKADMLFHDADATASVRSGSAKSHRSKETSIDTESTKMTANGGRQIRTTELKLDPLAQKLAETQMATSGPRSRQSNARLSGSSGSVPASIESNHPGSLASDNPSMGPVSRDMLVSYLRSMGTSQRTAMRIAATFRQQQEQQQQEQQRQAGPTTRSNLATNSGVLPPTLAPPVPSQQPPPSSGRPGDARRPRGRGRAGRGRGVTYERAMQPGAVPMEGRAFGAPRRPDAPPVGFVSHSSTDDVLPDVTLDLGLVQATAVKEAAPAPVVYADSTPLSVKDLLKEKPIRRRLFFLAFLIAAVVAISVSVVVVRGGGETTQSSSEEGIAPTGAPSFSPTMIKADILDYVIQLSGVEALNNTESPQFKAVGWMSTFDILTEGFGEMFDQRYAMATMFYSTRGEVWLEKDNWLTPDVHECDWSGAIFCKVDGTGRRLVNGLDLTRNGLDGPLPGELALAPQIEFLRLSKNKISSSLPSSIFNLPNLGVLDINTNLLTGKIPETLGNGKDLVLLDMSYNKLSGEIPTGLFSLNVLRICELHHNEISGTINMGFQNLKVLSKVDISSNLMTGTIPNFEITPTFDIINIGSNLISGTIPSWFTALLTRQELVINDNFLVGPIPGISSEAVTSVISDPNALASIRLRKFDGANNELTGTLPNWAGYLPSIQYFDVTNNKFTGTIPFSSILGEQLWAGLETVRLGNNLLHGTLAAELPPKVRELDVSYNMLTGSIPDTFATLTSLQYINLDQNPDMFCDVAVLLKSAKNLKTLSVAGTNMTGRIVGEEFESLSNIEILNLANNTISGTIPSEWGQLRSLKKLQLSSNSLTGIIPTEIGLLDDLLNLELDTNDLSGVIPQELSSLGSLEVLTLSRNPQLIGTISDELCQLEVNLTRSAIGCGIDCSCCSGDEGLCSAPGVPVQAALSGDIFDRKRHLRG